MMSKSAQGQLFETKVADDVGQISIRVVVLPPKKSSNRSSVSTETEILDLQDDEQFLVEDSSTPMGSYLESSKGGKRCIVFLVNGQRQHFLDNNFIVKELGLKYLRNRMLISIEVDDLTPEAIGKLTQSSRQSFYNGDIYNAILKRVIAVLKSDPDLERLHEEAESQLSNLEAGDERVKQYLDQLINDHHNSGWHTSEGEGFSGAGSGADFGTFADREGKVVSLFDPARGTGSEYPVLMAQPQMSTLRLRPNEERTIGIKSAPPNAWPALSSFVVQASKDMPELKVKGVQLPDRGEVSLQFVEPEGFDLENYPLNARIVITAEFNGIEQPRQLVLGVLIKPDKEKVPPILLDEPTKLLVTSRQPIKIRPRRQRHSRKTQMGWEG